MHKFVQYNIQFSNPKEPVNCSWLSVDDKSVQSVLNFIHNCMCSIHKLLPIFKSVTKSKYVYIVTKKPGMLP